MTPPKLLILLPTLNEAGCLQNVIQALLDLPYSQREIVVLDDRSTDGTPEVVQKFAAKDAPVRLIARQPPRGRGHAIRDGLLYGLAQGASHFIEMDADGSHRPEDVPRLLEALQTADISVGSRQIAGGNDSERSWGRRFLTQSITGVARQLLGLPIRDINSGFRGYTRHAVEAVQPQSWVSREPSVVYEALVRARQAGLILQEVPIDFAKRMAGESKLNVGRLLRGLFWLGELSYRSVRGSK